MSGHQQLGRELRRSLAAELDQLGIAVEFGITNGSHQFAQFYVDGRRRRYFFPLTPSDQRARKQAISGIRRLIREARV